MAHNLHGDIPQEHLELAKDLEEMEAFFDSKINFFQPSMISKGYVCIAFDWYEMGDDDKGSLLLDKANKVCPGYFNNEIHRDIMEDELFALVVKQLTKNILNIANSILGNK